MFPIYKKRGKIKNIRERKGAKRRRFIMALVTIKNAVNPIKLSLLSGTVPALVGFHGIGRR